ncbi:glycosyltransferase [Paenibacillus sp. SI8]|uniref:glycosyltransferase n=1 Tax=unclassified Paenibacillus TaxID=185978 RepID=UPI0034675CFA
MKVLMIVSRLNIGGTEKYILSISRYLLSKGVEVGVAAKKGPLVNSFERAGISVHLLPIGAEKRASSLSSIIANGGYSLIHAHDSKSFYDVATLSRKLHIPFIASVHGTYLDRNAVLAMSKVAKKIITVSPQLSEWLNDEFKIPKHNIHMIPNGIDTSIFSSISEKNKCRMTLRLPRTAQILVYAGRFSFDKYHIARKVILAAEIIAKKNPNFMAILFGPGLSYRLRLIRLANVINRRLGRQAIFIRPALSNVQNAYYAADVVVGTGRVALEAMACARPVVAVGVKGYCGVVEPENINQIIHNHFGDHGTAAPITVANLSRDCERILNNPKMAQLLGEFGKQTVGSKFSINWIGSKLLEVYMKYQ